MVGIAAIFLQAIHLSEVGRAIFSRTCIWPHIRMTSCIAKFFFGNKQLKQSQMVTKEVTTKTQAKLLKAWKTIWPNSRLGNNHSSQ